MRGRMIAMWPARAIIGFCLSERLCCAPNRQQFHSFYDMLYELSTNELKATQIILIDKEFAAPSKGLDVTVMDRHMKPLDPENPPLIPYYRGN